tara:strand:- start:4945 stop:5439 length:495 start_codon:yes stop_codon:yes gene_type:complete
MAIIYNTPNNVTYRNVIDTFNTIATNHFEIKFFKTGSLNDVDIDKLDATQFVMMYVEPQPVSIDTQTLTYSFDVIIADRILEDYSNQTDAYSETLQIMKDVIANFRQSMSSTSWADSRTEIELPISLNPFTSRFANMLTGWVGTFNIVVNNDNNLCISPQTFNS